ncbi:MAG: hypothetical protein HQL80_05235 [Magnetococcales bacterium]|nr:hypothetical protein [Magnetococcales bacterium]
MADWINVWYHCSKCGSEKKVQMRELDFDARPFDHDALDMNIRTERNLRCKKKSCHGKMIKSGRFEPFIERRRAKE